MFVGMGASKVHDLLNRQRKKRLVLSLLMIDAIGKNVMVRWAEMMSAEQTLNQLTEMDGFEGNNGVIIWLPQTALNLLIRL